MGAIDHPAYIGGGRATALAISILDRLGEPAVAKQCGLGRDALRKWRRRGIPAKHSLQLADLAEKLGVKLTLAEILGAQSPPPAPTNPLPHERYRRGKSAAAAAG